MSNFINKRVADPEFGIGTIIAETENNVVIALDPPGYRELIVPKKDLMPKDEDRPTVLNNLPHKE